MFIVSCLLFIDYYKLKIYLGIGGNLGNRLKNIRTAIDLISESIAEPEKASSVYLSEPWGFDHSKYFTNAVVKIDTNKQPEEILKIILDIETQMKRTRNSSGYQGRTMDIDILYFGDLQVQTNKIQIPHPRITERLFVLLPLAEIERNLSDPVTGKNIMMMLSECKDISKIRKLQYGT